MSIIISIKLGSQLKKEKRSRYWLTKNTNITFTAINKLINKEASGIYFDTLEKLCIALNCEPSDIIEWNKEKNTNEQTFEKIRGTKEN